MDIEPIYRCAVGMDVHLRVVQVCVISQEPGQAARVEQRQFGAFQRDRRAMAEWIAQFSPEVVVMESTGVYWKSPYVALERVGLRPLVVNAQHVKQVPGRKTDIADAEWLAMLARSGLLRGSFIPPVALRQLRLISRRHHQLTAQLGAEKNRLVRVLADAGIRLSAVVSDPHGVAATAMIECLLEGGTPAQALQFAGRLKAPPEDLLAALEGELSPEHQFVARQLRRHIQTLEADLAELEQYLFEAIQPYEPAIELLLTIPGVDRLSAANLVVEIGDEMGAFGSADKLCKWAGLCPGNHESAGKRKRARTTPGNRYLRRVLCEIAWAAVRTPSQFKHKFQSLVIRRGTKRAIIAIAHKVLKTVFVLLSRQVPYRDTVVDYEALAVKRNAPRWIRQLLKFGYLTQPA